MTMATSANNSSMAKSCDSIGILDVKYMKILINVVQQKSSNK
jgi:hypothetical protein